MTQERFSESYEFSPPWSPSEKYNVRLGSTTTGGQGGSVIIDAAGYTLTFFLGLQNIFELLVGLRGLHTFLLEEAALELKAKPIAEVVDDNVTAAEAEAIPF